MNEQINNLRLDAGISTLHDAPYLVAINKSGEIIDPIIGLEKFAELIVRMCADAADMYEGKSDCVGDCVAEYMGYGEAEGITEWRSK